VLYIQLHTKEIYLVMVNTNVDYLYLHVYLIFNVPWDLNNTFQKMFRGADQLDQTR